MPRYRIPKSRVAKRLLVARSTFCRYFHVAGRSDLLEETTLTQFPALSRLHLVQPNPRFLRSL